MKKILFLLPTLFHFAAGSQPSNERAVKSSISNVTVFTQGAQVFRSAPVIIVKGVTTLVFHDVSPFINSSSIQAGGKGNFVILEVKHEIKYPEPASPAAGSLPPDILREIKWTEDSLIELGFSQDELTEKQNALLLEKNMIQKNKLAIGEGKSDSLPVLKQAMDFFRSKLNDINLQMIRLKRTVRQVNDRKDQLTERLNNLKAYKNDQAPDKNYQPEHRVLVCVSADEPASGTVDLSYMVTNSGWTPSYDLRSSGIAVPLQLTYKANVFQNTGESWDNVALKLSTGNPIRSSTKPELPVWYLNYYFPARVTREMNAMPAATLDEDKNEMELQKKMKDMGAAQSAANYTQIIETMTTVEFDVKLSYSIPSDGVSHLVSMKTEEMPATYIHYLVPKLDKDAFLVARVTGWEDLNLLPGEASIFYEGGYTGHTMINPQVLDDTLELSLGRDRSIAITRTKLPDTERNKLLGNEITKTFTYELKLKNSKNSKLNLVIQDQVPLTQNKDIRIELKDNGNAAYNGNTGMLKWDTSLNGHENKTFSFSYAVTYQKGMQLSMF